MSARSHRDLWLLVSLLLGVAPSLLGWLMSYGASLTALSLMRVCATLVSLAAVLFWAIRGRAAGEKPIAIGVGVAVWGLAVVGAFQLGVWLSYSLWNPAWSKPFMTDSYAATAGLLGGLLCTAAVVLFVVSRFRRNLSHG
ncbi:MAG: hypothetical protein EON90_01090 [Brevundimonas sp.]|nr:MAG: hypothetical protein EON90_01090 [Brevundimonas sp.]